MRTPSDQDFASIKNQPTILVLVGPTASGKTAVSLHLARLLGGEIISADSRQVYKHLDIGTAKPAREERTRIPHHFLDELNPDQEFNAGEFGQGGRELIRRLFQKRRLPIVVGGSGLYVRSLIDGIFEGPGADEEYRKILEQRLRDFGVGKLLDELRAVDPESAALIDPTKPRRIIRALEVFALTGTPLSKLHVEHRAQVQPLDAVQIALTYPREVLYERINARVDAMMKQGFV